jgi:hypothetical protein
MLKDYCLSVYFTWKDIQDLLLDGKRVSGTIRYLKRLRFRKAYLEAEKSGVRMDKAAFSALRTLLENNGILVSGAFVPAWKKGPYCYNNPAHMKEMASRIADLASVFDEVIIDDWYFSVCLCPACVRQRGRKSWQEHRGRLLAERAKRWITAPARKANPDVSLIVKFPNWYEGWSRNGYDVPLLAGIFGRTCAGIETRQPERQHQHIPVYSGYFLQRWIDKARGAERMGSWFDNHSVKGWEGQYILQVYQSLLGRSAEHIHWRAGLLFDGRPFNPVYNSLRRSVRTLDRMKRALTAPPVGVPYYIPFRADGEYNLFGYLGSAGIPLEPVTEFPAGKGDCVLTLHASADRDLAAKVLAKLRDGGRILMTWDLFKKLSGSDLRNAFNVIGDKGFVTASRIRTARGADRKLSRPVTIEKVRITTWPYERLVSLVQEDGDFPVLMRSAYLNGELFVLNVPQNSHDLTLLPAAALGALRRIFMESLGFWLDGRGQVALYLFKGNRAALCNMKAGHAAVTVMVKRSFGDKWKELLHNKPLLITEDPKEKAWFRITLLLGPFEAAVIKSE